MAAAKTFTFHAETARTPDARADEDGIVAIAEQRVQCDDTANRRIGADMDAEFHEFFLIAIQDGKWQAERRDAVTHHAAELALAFKNRDVVTALGQFNADCYPGRARTDHCDVLSLGRLMLHDDLIEIDVRDVMLNA